MENVVIKLYGLNQADTENEIKENVIRYYHWDYWIV